MGIREKLERNPVPVKIGAALLVAICAAVIYFQLSGPRQFNPAVIDKQFYSDDDGKTWFLADMSKPSPFDHNGKPAYRALVFRCPAGGAFVGFLTKYSDQLKQQADAATAKALAGTPSHLVGNPTMDLLRKPGESKWQTNSNPSQSGLPEVRCPDGKGIAVPVRPSDLETGATN